jgi:hypothetical protein
VAPFIAPLTEKHWVVSRDGPEPGNATGLAALQEHVCGDP